MLRGWRRTKCIIWRNDEAIWEDQHGSRMIRVDSPRAGGVYEIPKELLSLIDNMSDKQKARLTTWLIDRRARGTKCPIVTKEIIEYVKNTRPLPAYKRAERLLRLIAEKSETVGSYVPVRESTPDVYAWSESTTWEEVNYFFYCLGVKGWIGNAISTEEATDYVVTMDGYSQIEKGQIINSNSNQGFVAMWLDDKVVDAFENGIKPGIEDAGYKVLRIDQKFNVNKIDDEIIAEIRRSRFLVADFTQGDDGARGSVYYEAGFASGLGIPVIYLCRKDQKDKLHFDTRQYYHILWNDISNLRNDLRTRIQALIGDGPGTRVDA